MNKLTPPETSRLKQLEKTIESGKQAFVDVGIALAEIRDKKLYRALHDTFEIYCDKIWGWSKQHAYRLIEAAPVAKSNLQVTSQNAANALAKVPPPKRASVIASIPGKVTAASVKKAAAIPPRKAARIILDGTGLEVPPEVLDLWNRMPEAQELLTGISHLRGILKKAQDEKDPLFVEVDFTDNLAKLNQVYLDLQRAKPFAVCPTCSGVDLKGCMACKGRGIVSEFYWRHNVPQETKKLTGRK